MTQVNTILEELRTEIGEAKYLILTSCGDVRCHWEGRRDALARAIEIVEKVAAEPTIITNPDEPPRPASIWIEIPIASIRNVSFEREVGPTITFNPRDPRNWEPGVISVPYETATKAMAMLK